MVIPMCTEDIERGMKYTISRSNLEESTKGSRPAKIVLQKENFKVTHFDIVKLIPSIGLLKPFIDTKKLVMIQETYSGTSKRIGSNRIAYKCPMVKSFEAFIYCICIGNDIGARDDVFESDTDYMTEFCSDENALKPPDHIIDIDFINYGEEKDNEKREIVEEKEDVKLSELTGQWLEKHKQQFSKNSTNVASSCLYRRIMVDIKIPFAHRMKKMILEKGMLSTITKTYRKMFKWKDEWYNMTLSEIESFAAQNKQKLSIDKE